MSFNGIEFLFGALWRLISARNSTISRRMTIAAFGSSTFPTLRLTVRLRKSCSVFDKILISSRVSKFKIQTAAVVGR